MPIEKRKQSDLRKPKSKPIRPSRTANKTQVSMRIDNNLYDKAMQWVNAERTFFTNAVEEALWFWIKNWKDKKHHIMRPSSEPDRLTYLAKTMPPDMEKFLMRAAAYVLVQREGSDEAIRRLMLKHMEVYGEDPKSDCRSNLQIISEWKPEDDARRIAIPA